MPTLRNIISTDRAAGFRQVARLCAVLLGTLSGAAAEDSGKTFVVVGYLPSYRLTAFDAARGKLVTDVVLFSIEPREDGSLGDDRLPERELQPMVEKLHQSGCRVHVTVGGWGRSTAFALVTADEARRRRLAQSLADFCERNGLDGVDVDWEHPRTDAERTQLGVFLTELKSAVEPHGRTVSIAVAPWEQLAPATIDAVDRVHLMAYDNGGRHSTLEYADESIRSLLKLGVPAEKLCLGIPFYGRPFQGKFGAATTYAELAGKHELLPDSDEVDGVYFNGPETVAAKVQLARRHQLAGVMVWELGQDLPAGDRSLLEAIHAVASQPSISETPPRREP